MKLSTRAQYALRMMVEIANRAEGGKNVNLTQIAESCGLSRRYLEQLAIGLKTASLITGITGQAGGYSLARAPDQIEIGQVIEAVIGPVNIVECVLKPETCRKSDECSYRCIYLRINERITEVLTDLTLADLAAGRVPRDEVAVPPH